MVPAVQIEMPPPYSNERRGKQMTTRTSQRLVQSIEKLARLWEAKERQKQRDPELHVTSADVVNRLLDEGLEAAWKDAGWVNPPDEKGQPQPDFGPPEDELAKLIKKHTKPH